MTSGHHRESVERGRGAYSSSIARTVLGDGLWPRGVLTGTAFLHATYNAEHDPMQLAVEFMAIALARQTTTEEAATCLSRISLREIFHQAHFIFMATLTITEVLRR